MALLPEAFEMMDYSLANKGLFILGTESVVAAIGLYDYLK